MNNFNTYLNYIDVNFWRDFCTEHGTLRRYRKGEYFLHTDENCHSVGFILSGTFKYTIMDAAGEEHITGFSFAGTPVTEYASLITGGKVKANVVAATPAEALVCPAQRVAELFQSDTLLHTSVADALFFQTYDRFLKLYSCSPKERYLELLAQSPELLQDISLKELASYLQITPTHLSRIRREISHENLFSPHV